MSAIAVGLCLVLLVDVSGSINADNFKLQKEGIVSAMTDKSVARAITVEGGIVVAYLEWDDAVKVVVPWTVLRTIDDAVVFAGAVAAADRSGYGSTGLYKAMEFAIPYMQTAPVPCYRMVIDVSGDGANNAGGVPQVDRAEEAGITVNGLPILGEKDLFEHYDTTVRTSNGFILPAEDFSDFSRALRQKLAREIVVW